MMLNDPSGFDLKEQMMLDDSYSSINSLDIHAANKATILKKAGSTRRNLPELELKTKNVALAGSTLQTNNQDLVEFDLEKDRAAFPPVTDIRDPHYRS